SRSTLLSHTCFAAGKSSGSTLNTSGRWPGRFQLGWRCVHVWWPARVTARRRGDRMIAAMKRREFMTLLGGAAVAWPIAARARQPGKLPTIGFLGSTTASSGSQWVVGFVQRLRELGWIEGHTVAIEYRWAEGRKERADELAAEFVQLKVDLIMTYGTRCALAAKQATNSVPIVFALPGDPVATGLVASLARPGSNITGVSSQGTDLATKRLQ